MSFSRDHGTPDEGSVGDAGLSIADAGNVNAVSKKPKRGKRRCSGGSMLTRGEIVVNFADMSMT